jgi:hypothetical protein
MFTIPRANVIASDDGFSVEVLGRTGVRYVERGRTMTIDSEVLAGPSGLVIYTDSINKWDDGETVDDVTRQRIVENARAAFRFRGLEIQVQ